MKGIELSKYQSSFTRQGTIEVLPGKTSIFNVGGMGHPVIGRFEISDEVEGLDVGRHSIKTKTPDCNYPDNFDTMTSAESIFLDTDRSEFQPNQNHFKHLRP